ncbi:MAG: hypothetical protein ACT4QB_05560 [Gammaproteobacteria bacterium]
MSSAKREQPTVLRWDDVVELVRRGNVAPPRRVTFPFPQKGRPAADFVRMHAAGFEEGGSPA